jgi:transglutaminase-like putative cysteine protease
MKLQASIETYLMPTATIDADHPAIVERAQKITTGLRGDAAQAQALFVWVRDAIPHSHDIKAHVVTCSASQVLKAGTGICFAKSHLLAALLRASGIPAGLCYQVFRRDPPDSGFGLHGLNALYLRSLKRWLRVDPRGNTGAIDAQFVLHGEQLAFPPRADLGEFVYETIYADAALEVVNALSSYDDFDAMWEHLPGPLTAL